MLAGMLCLVPLRQVELYPEVTSATPCWMGQRRQMVTPYSTGLLLAQHFLMFQHLSTGAQVRCPTKRFPAAAEYLPHLLHHTI